MCQFKPGRVVFLGDMQTSDSYATKTENICYAFMQIKPEKYAPITGFMQLFK